MISYSSKGEPAVVVVFEAELELFGLEAIVS
jgi:hypothetical protein